MPIGHPVRQSGMGWPPRGLPAPDRSRILERYRTLPSQIPHPVSTDPSAASATRRATAGREVFLIPTADLHPALAERVDNPAALEPVTPRPAATVVLLRDTPGGAEALLLRRHKRSGFAADAWVFPGGTVDPTDRDPALAERCVGPTPTAWAHRLELTDPAEAVGYVAAAVRETFEETGILLAREHGAPACSRRDYRDARRALLAERRTLRELALEEGVHLATAELLYLAHWITPEAEPRRYDTRFFLARVPDGAECVPHAAELTEARWMSPSAAVESFAAGDMRMLPPTVDTLRRLAPFGTVAAAWEVLVDAPVPTILPRMRRHPEGVAIDIPPVD